MQPGQRVLLRIVGLVTFTLAIFLGWRSHWFHADHDLSRYPQIQLTYATARFERVMYSRSGSARRVALVADDGTTFVMEDGVWKSHFDGPALASRLSAGGTVRAWVHPDYPHALRGLMGGAVAIPPEWGLAYDQRNMHLGVWVDGILVLLGLVLLGWPF
jgi:hypothetical protein